MNKTAGKTNVKQENVRKEYTMTNDMSLIMLKIEELSAKVNCMVTKNELNESETRLKRFVDNRYFSLKDKIEAHESANKNKSEVNVAKNLLEDKSVKEWIQMTIEESQKTAFDKLLTHQRNEMRKEAEEIRKQCKELVQEKEKILKDITQRQITEMQETFKKEILNIIESNMQKNKTLLNKDDTNVKERISTLEANYKNSQIGLQDQLKQTNESIISLKEVTMNRLLELTSKLEAYKQGNSEAIQSPKPKTRELIIESSEKRNKTLGDDHQLVISSKKIQRPPRINCEEVPLFAGISSNEGKSDDEKPNCKFFSQSNSYSSDVFCEPSEHEFGNPEEDKELLKFIRDSIKGNIANGICSMKYYR